MTQISSSSTAPYSREMGCGAMKPAKGLFVLLGRVLVEGDLRPNAPKGWLQFDRAELDDRLFPAPPSAIAVLEGALALKTRQEAKGALAQYHAVEDAAGQNVEPRPSNLGNKFAVLDCREEGIDVFVPHA